MSVLRRLYLYPMTLLALALIVQGLPMLAYWVLYTGLVHVSGPHLQIGLSKVGEELRNGVGLTLAGLALWSVHWGYANRVASQPDDRGAAERRSTIRRAFLLVVIFLGALTLMTYTFLMADGVVALRRGRLTALDMLGGELIGVVGGFLVYAALVVYHLWILHRDRHPHVAAESPPIPASAADDEVRVPDPGLPMEEAEADVAALPALPARGGSVFTSVVVSCFLLLVIVPSTLVVGGWAVSLILGLWAQRGQLEQTWPLVGPQLLGLAVGLIILIVVWVSLARMLHGETTIAHEPGDAGNGWWVYIYVAATMGLLFGAGGLGLTIARLAAVSIGPMLTRQFDGVQGGFALDPMPLGIGITAFIIWWVHQRMATHDNVVRWPSRPFRRAYQFGCLAVGALVIGSSLRFGLPCCPDPSASFEAVAPPIMGVAQALIWMVVVGSAIVWPIVREAQPNDWETRLVRRLLRRRSPGEA